MTTTWYSIVNMWIRVAVVFLPVFRVILGVIGGKSLQGNIFFYIFQTTTRFLIFGQITVLNSMHIYLFLHKIS